MGITVQVTGGKSGRTLTDQEFRKSCSNAVLNVLANWESSVMRIMQILDETGRLRHEAIVCSRWIEPKRHCKRNDS
jgi:hypothetical protein